MNQPQDNADDSPGAPPSGDRSTLRQCVEQMLQQRDVLAPALTAFAEELPPGQTRRELSERVDQLRGGITAEEICHTDEQAARWLPLLGFRNSSPQSLTTLFEEAAGESESRNQWTHALVYPAIILVASVLIFLFLCVAVVPTFTEMYHDFGLRLPKATQLLVNISETVLHHPIALLMIGIALCLVGYLLFGLLRLWGLPGRVWSALTSGSSRQVSAMARLTRRLAEALEAGIELPLAFRLAAKHEPHRTTRELAMQLGEAEASSKSNQESTLVRLPTTVRYALTANQGMPSTALLKQISRGYVERVAARSSLVAGFASQLGIVAIGGVVGFVVIALFWPLVSLVDALS